MAKKTKSIKFYEGVGRRKEAVARVRLFIVDKEKTASVGSLKIKAGQIYINKKSLDEYFFSLTDKIRCLFPLKITNNEDRFAISIVTKGGGKEGQLGAIIQGLARALDVVDHDAHHPLLKKNKLLTRDSRTRERRKIGMGGKARRKKQSPKR